VNTPVIVASGTPVRSTAHVPAVAPETDTTGVAAMSGARAAMCSGAGHRSMTATTYSPPENPSESA